jgi:hypothetical protein
MTYALMNMHYTPTTILDYHLRRIAEYVTYVGHYAIRTFHIFLVGKSRSLSARTETEVLTTLQNIF